MMRPLTLRALTLGEQALAAEVFGRALDAARVRILALPVWRRAFVAGPALIVWPARLAAVDFAAAPLGVQAVLIHELTHVWQAQRGVSLILGKLKAGDSLASYAYDLDGVLTFAGLNIEQQAMVVEHAFLASRGEAAPYSPAIYAKAACNWRQA